MGNRSARVIVCLRCQNLKRHEARGLCKCCYNHLREHRCRMGESLASYPTMQEAPRVTVGVWSEAERMRRYMDEGAIAREEIHHHSGEMPTLRTREPVMQAWINKGASQ